MVLIELAHALPTHATGLATCQLLASFHPIQNIRDTTQAIYGSGAVRAALVVGMLAVVVPAGAAAWREGSASRKRAGGIPSTAFLPLLGCIVFDIIGDASYVAGPGLGQFGDLFWGPASAFLLLQVFGSEIIALIQLLKEVLPLPLDFLPIATATWLLKYGFPESKLTRAIGIKPSAWDRDDDEPGPLSR